MPGPPPRGRGAPLLAKQNGDPLALSGQQGDHLRRLGRAAALLAACERLDDVERAIAEVLSLVPARMARIVEIRGGDAAVVAAWPDAARDAAPADASPARASLDAGTPLWLESTEAIAARSEVLGKAAALLGVRAWGAIPIRAGPTPAAVELGLDAAPPAEAGEREHLVVAAMLLGAATLRARSAAVESEVARLEAAEAGARCRVGDLESALELFPVGVGLFSASGEVERINRSARDLLGFAEADVPSRPGDVLERLEAEWPDGSRARFPEMETPLARALRGEVVRDELLTLQPEGDVRRWVLVSAVPLAREGEVRKVVASIVDVTRTRELEIERQELLHHLFHELAPPLKAIEERAERIREGHHGDCEGASARAGEIVRAVRRMTSNLKELQTALRFDARSLTATHPELLDVKAFLLDVVERLAAEVDVSRLILSLPPGLPKAHVDPDHLEKILVDLCRGALAGAPPGSDVLVACAPAEGRLRITFASSAQDIVAEDLPRVFERFFRARGRPAGRLYLVRGLVEANRGRVRAEIGPGRSLAIQVDLPLRAPEPP